MSWKMYLGVVYGGFVLLIGMMVAVAYSDKLHLVSKNYYEEELAYQQKQNALSRGARYEGAIDLVQGADSVSFAYPAHLGNEKVEVKWYCVSDASKDFKSKLNEKISKGLLRRGAYKLWVHWGLAPIDTMVEVKTFIE